MSWQVSGSAKWLRSATQRRRWAEAGAVGWRRPRETAGNPQLRRAAANLLEQATVSGTNFLTTMVIGRLCLPKELGWYSMGFSLIVLLNGLSCALVWMPYTIRSPGLPSARLSHFTASACVHMVAFCLVATVALIAAASAAGASMGRAELSGVLFALSAATASMVFREFVRRVYLAQMRVWEALLLNLGVTALQLGGLAAMAAAERLNARSAFAVIAVAGGGLSTVWLLLERRRLRLSWPDVQRDWLASWLLGRWMFAASLVRILANDIYPWVLAAYHGPSSVGLLAAASGVVYFSNPLLISAWNYLGPMSAHTYTQAGMEGLQRLVRRATVALLAVTIVLFVVLSAWGEQLVQLLYGPQYAATGGTVRALGLRVISEAACLPVGLGLLAQQRTTYELKTALTQLAVMVTMGIVCVRRFGAAGVGYGATAGYVASAALLWHAFKPVPRNEIEEDSGAS